MGTRTTVNGQTVVHKDSGGVLNTTDVCKTQVGNAVVPIPYSNVAKSEDTSKGSKNVFFDGNPIMLKDSEFSKSTGDEPGNQKGVMSGTTGDIAKFTNYSFDVTVEGQNVCRRLDTMTSNNQNTPPGTLQQENLDGGEDAEKEEKIIQAKITKVSFDSPIKVAFDKKTINAPHWQEGSDDTSNIEGYGICSKKPAAYSVADAKKSDCKVTVNVNVTKLENISGKATLIGHLGGLKMQGELELTGAQEYSVPAKVENPPDSVQWYRGKISWQLTLETESETRALNSTFGELFFVLDKPADFYENTDDEEAAGVWAEVLRFLCKKAGVLNARDEKTVASNITRYCHGKHGLKYDTYEGYPSYGGDGEKPHRYKSKLSGGGGKFCLQDYLIQKYTEANCYDQAAAIQALCGATGTKLKWKFMQPFGFIKTTNLLGWGECNNPFFKSDSSKKLVKRDDPDRTFFMNHAFCQLEDKTVNEDSDSKTIYDACGGPHINDSRTKYIASSIDAETILYKRYEVYGLRAGKEADLDNYDSFPGITGVN